MYIIENRKCVIIVKKKHYSWNMLVPIMSAHFFFFKHLERQLFPHSKINKQKNALALITANY